MPEVLPVGSVRTTNDRVNQFEIQGGENVNEKVVLASQGLLMRIILHRSVMLPLCHL